MKLRTSYFNPTVLKKDITRFAPVWALYTIYLLIYVILGNGDSSPAAFANRIPDIMAEYSWVNLIYAGIAAVMVFGDLFKSRMCNALHAMPMRREGWFLTHSASGLLFALVPNLVAVGVACLILQQYSYMAFIWLGAAMLQYLFFFALAAFCVQCSGSRLAMAGMYCLLNFLAPLIFWLAELLYMPYLYGLTLDFAPFQFLCPVAQISFQDLVLFEYDKSLGGIWGGFVAESWHYLFGLAAVGLAIGALALLLYRRRDLECAGDFLVLKPAKLLFLVLAAVSSGTVLYAIAESAIQAAGWLFMLIGVAIGFFAAMMLLRRTVRVFGKKNWLGLLAMAGCLVLSMGLARLDPIGITRRIPETPQVKSVQIHSSNDDYFLSRLLNDPLEYAQPEDIDTIRQLHALILENRPDRDEFTAFICQVELTYKLKDGTTLRRTYNLPRAPVVQEVTGKLFSSPQYILQTEDWNSIAESLNLIIFRSDLGKYDASYTETYKEFWITEPEDIRALMDAVYQDCLAGNMAQHWYYHQEQPQSTELWLGLPSENKGGYNFEKDGQVHYSKWYRDLMIFDDCAHTNAFLADYVATHQESTQPTDEPTLEDKIAGVS